MKKLTALALAGVLCMGMSATAFAAGSVTPATFEQKVTDMNGTKTEKVTLDTEEVTGDALAYKNAWKITDTVDYQTAQANIKRDLAEMMGQELPGNAAYKLVDFADYKAPESMKDKEIELTFSINDQWVINTIKEQQRLGNDKHYIYLAHWKELPKDQQTTTLKGKWEVIKVEVKEEKNEDGTFKGFYVKHKFDKLSPIALVYSAEFGTDDSNPPIVDPGTKPNPDDNNGSSVAPTPGNNNNNGSGSSVTVTARPGRVIVRTGVSPKTGE